jgi:hypothetical protein
MEESDVENSRGNGTNGFWHTARPTLGLALLGLLLVGLIGASSAGASPKHPFVEDFGSVNEPTFSAVAGLAVDQSTGDVLVIDTSNKTLSRWHSDGTASNFAALGTNVIDGQGTGDGTPQNGILGEFTGSKEVQVAVDNSGGATDGNIYVTDSSHGAIDIFGSDGTYLGQLTAAGPNAFGEACGVAVDPSGTLYVAEYGGQVHVYDPAGAVPANTDNTFNFAATEPCTLAAGAGPTAGYVFVATWGGPVVKYDASTGAEEYVVASGSNTTVSVDPATGDVYVASGEVVREYDASGASSATLVSTIATDSTFSVEGVAVDGNSGKVYVGRGGTPHLEVFGALPQPKHPFVEDFGSVNEPTFSAVAGLAVDQSTGDVLVIDTSNKTLSRWHSDGTASNFAALGTNVIDGQGTGDGTPQNGILGEFTGSKEVQVAVDNSGGATDGNIYVTDSSHGAIDIFGSDGTYLGQLTAAGPNAFGEACGVAVDPSGTLYVAEYGGQVHVYDPAGAVPANTDNTFNFAATEPCTLAAGAGPTAGYVFVATWGGPVVKYDASTGAEEYVVASGSNTTVSVDPATGDVYVASGEVVREYDASGASSATLVSTIATDSTFSVEGVAVDGNSGKVYVGRGGTPHLEVFGALVFGEAPLVTTGGVSALGNNEVTLEGTVDPNEDETAWQFEYGLTTAYGNLAPSTPGSTGAGGAAVPVSTALNGLQAGTEYHYRLRATNSSGSVTGEDMTFTTASGAFAETTGSPVRSATSARLEGRVSPMGASTTYHFEYGTAGSCASNPCQATPARSAGSANQYVLVSEEITSLQPGTTYYYRLVADNGNTAGQALGGDMSVITRSSDAPPAPAPFPGPPESDRGWEQVSAADANGNPVSSATAISDDGERVIYQVNGGTPDSPTGTVFTHAFAERRDDGWKAVNALPSRDELSGGNWLAPLASPDLSTTIFLNSGYGGVSAIRVRWESGAENIYKPDAAYDGYFEGSADASRVIIQLTGSLDPDHPVVSNSNLYDVSSGTPKLVSLLPGEVVPACGVLSGQPSLPAMPENIPNHAENWVSEDGSYLVFPSEGDTCGTNRYQLYLRNLEGEVTKLLSGPVLSGPHCGAEFIKATTGAVFFWTRSRLAAEDNPVFNCEAGGGDVYRYDIASEALDCVTCVSATVEADLPRNDRFALGRIGIAADGSRVYFRSPNRLVQGSAAPGLYRVRVDTGQLRYIAPASGTEVGELASQGEAMSTNGAAIVFRSDNPALNPVNGTDNGNTFQYYRYDDRDRSLVCVSCPQDGSAPESDVAVRLVGSFEQAGPNLTPMDEEGDFAFVTSTPLASPDHNTAGQGQQPFVGNDVYEWRDGRLLLVTDGGTQWAGGETVSTPGVSGITPSGRDLFFTVPKQLTFDAIDGFSRLYDARIGGGFPAPPAAESCSDSACVEGSGSQPPPPAGTSPGTSSFTGPADPKPHFGRKKHRHKHHRRRRHRHKRHHHKVNRPQINASWRVSR